ncbi:MAG: alkaline phosphatase family protein [Acidimicrobiia bacterium]|nr:alkaline phosphatase family protein [Acidimicrobiia bacterium]
MTSISRRSFLKAGAAAGGAAMVAKTGRAWAANAPAPPGTRPYPNLPEGVDTLPQIEHIVVLMMENHSFDNYFGLLGRGDGFALDASGKPTATNPDGKGNLVHAFHMPTPCQLQSKPSQAWNASHVQYAGGTNQGFVISDSGPVAMGYWTGDDLPFYYGLAKAFPIADRYFCSTLAQTFPNRRFLHAASAFGLINDPLPGVNDPPPPTGTIYDRLNAHGITWKNYFVDLPDVGLFPYVLKNNPGKAVPISQFYVDAAAGTLPSYSVVSPEGLGVASEENPQNIQLGESFAASVITAALHGLAWRKTLLIFNYDEHGGYYDHVPPPAAAKPDNIPPAIHVPPDQPGGYDRYGFRVPCVIASPYARKNYVSHVVHDHTSILRLVETKWNLGAMTYRDANASNLLDMVDLTSPPAFVEPPTLPLPALVTKPSACAVTGAGQIPPDSAVTPASASQANSVQGNQHGGAGAAPNAATPTRVQGRELAATGRNDRRDAIAALAALGAAAALRTRTAPDPANP